MKESSKRYPICIHEDDCFALFKGHCTLLDNTYFKGRACPFYKTREEVERNRRRTVNMKRDGYRCGNCGFEFSHKFDSYTPNYCPNCGAKVVAKGA